MLQDQILTQRPMKDGEPESLEKSGRRASRDSKLQISRRIDWRLLLPDPNLRRVAYLGPYGGALPAALNQFSDLLTIISPLGQPVYRQNDHSRFELVVLHSPDLADLDRASTFILPGGYLYWEIDRTKTWKERRRLRHFWDYAARVERLGFCNIQVSWHRPNFESCREIIPLNNPLALGYVFSRRPGNLAGHMKLAIGRYLMKTGLLARLVPCLSVVACKRLASTEAV
jgi:hypothetical protein